MFPVAHFFVFIAASAFGQQTDPCNLPSPSVSQCPARHLSVPSIPATIPQTATDAVRQADDAIKLERAAVHLWLEARKEFLNAQKELKESWALFNRDEKRTKYDQATRDYRSAAEAYSKARAASDLAANAAVTEVSAVFGLTPPNPDLNLTQPASHPLARWNPAFSRKEKKDPDTGNWRMLRPSEYEAEVRRLAANSNPSAPAMGPDMAVTVSYDGEIRVYGAAFSTPESLAATIIHESSHWVDIMGRGGARRREALPPAESFQSEVDAYQREADFYGRIGNTTMQENRNAIVTQFKIQIQVVQARRLTWDAIRTAPAYRGWYGVDQVLRRAGDPDDSKEDFNPDLTAIHEIQEGAKTLRARAEADADQRIRDSRGEFDASEAKRASHIRIANAAIGCGFEPDNTMNVRFRHGQNRIFAFQLKDEESYRASLLMAHACYASTDSSPCVNSFDTIKDNWHDEAFREKLYLAQGSADDATACVAALVSKMSAPKSYGDILKARDKFWQQRNRQKPPSSTAPTPPRNASPPDPSPRPREPRPSPPPDIPHCRRSGPWCEDPNARR